MNLSIENLVDFSSGEQIAEFATTADTHNKFHCILQEGSDDIAAALEDTLHRIIDAGGLAEDIHRIIGADNVDYSTLSDEELDEFLTIDLGYCICGSVIYFRILEDASAYRSYVMRWCAKNGIFLEELASELDLDDTVGLYSRILEFAREKKGCQPMGFLEYCRDPRSGQEGIRVETPHGVIRALKIPDNEYPGISLELVTKDHGEPGAIMEFNPNTRSVNLRVYGKNDPDGDPIDIFGMS